MASWRETLGKVEVDGKPCIAASFRGVPFYVETAELSGGRRIALHEYPLRDVPYAEDLGRRSRAFPVEGYVLGDDYVAKRNALIAALEEPGAGELVHPYFGTRRVVGSFRVRESTADGGLARFSIDFQETEVAPSFPIATPAGAASVTASADAAYVAVRDEFEAGYAVSGLPASALASLSGLVRAAAEGLDAALAPFVADTQALAALKRDLDALVLDADGLVRQPLEVLDGLTDVLASLGTPPLTPRLGISALLEAYGFTPPARPPGTTATRRREQAAFDALLRTVRTLVVVQAARLVLVEEHDSHDAAVALRDAITERLDEQAELVGDAAYPALAQLRADLVRAVPGEDSDLPRLVRYTPPYTVPSLVLAHRLYGDLAREADLVTRNGVAHPGFVRGGVELEVLSRA